MGTENIVRDSIERGEFPAFSFESFSQGKDKKNPHKNEDVVFVSPHTIAVIDGATSRDGLNFQNKSGGQYAAFAVAEFLRNYAPDVNGIDLINGISSSFSQKIIDDGYEDKVKNNPQSRPTASFSVAHLTIDEIIIMQLGDVGFRINGQDFHANSKKIDEIIAGKRVKAIEKKRKKNPDISHGDLMAYGRQEIVPFIDEQVIKFQNNPDSEFGYGVMDGREVPTKYVFVYRFKREDVKTLEIASDRYFMPGKEPSIDSWEKAFQYVEDNDPDKIGQFPSTKGSSKDSFTDDRTIVIARFNN